MSYDDRFWPKADTGEYQDARLLLRRMRTFPSELIPAFPAARIIIPTLPAGTRQA
jgi:hypothetical protein